MDSNVDETGKSGSNEAMSCVQDLTNTLTRFGKKFDHGIRMSGL